MRAPCLSLVVILLAGLGCASTGPTAAPSAERTIPPSAWAIGDAQGLDLLARIIQTDTRQPRGREANAAEPLRDFLLRAGVDARLLPLSRGRASVIAEVRGDAPVGAPPVVLLSHLDTHPATPEAWPREAGPLSAAIRGDALWGRGVLDGKGLAVLHALVLVVLAEAEVKLDRPVIMVAAAGGLEAETPGLAGAIEAAPRIGDPAVVLTKGGGSWIDLLGDGRIAHVVAHSERGFARLRVTAATRSDEAATREAPSVARLTAALDVVLSRIAAPRLTRPTLDTLEYASEDVYFPKSLVMRSTPLARTFLLQDLAGRESTAPLVTDEVLVTFVGSNRSGGQVAPDRAWARLEGRLLPGSTPGALRSRLRAAIKDPDVHVTVDSGASWSGSPKAPALLAAVAKHARVTTDRDQFVAPIMSPEPSGARPLRELGARVYGFTPFVLGVDEWGRAKGRDERLPLADFRRGIRTLTRVVLMLAADAAATRP